MSVKRNEANKKTRPRRSALASVTSIDILRFAVRPTPAACAFGDARASGSQAALPYPCSVEKPHTSMCPALRVSDWSSGATGVLKARTKSTAVGLRLNGLLSDARQSRWLLHRSNVTLPVTRNTSKVVVAVGRAVAVACAHAVAVAVAVACRPPHPQRCPGRVKPRRGGGQGCPPFSD